MIAQTLVDSIQDELLETREQLEAAKQENMKLLAYNQELFTALWSMPDGERVAVSIMKLHSTSEGLVECGNCFEGKSDSDHICQKCNGVGLVKAQIHDDDVAVDNFAVAMKNKLEEKRKQGKSGWQSKDVCSNKFLSDELFKHIEKGDPVDVANFCMMLHQRGENIKSLTLEKAMLIAQLATLANVQLLCNPTCEEFTRMVEFREARLADLNKEANHVA